jgi:hypothetical protein
MFNRQLMTRPTRGDETVVVVECVTLEPAITAMIISWDVAPSSGRTWRWLSTASTSCSLR